MLDELNELYQQTILEHSRHPRCFRVLPEANRTAEGNNPLCGDRFTIYIRLEKDVIVDISFQGAGCAVAKAAASLMSEEMKGKKVENAKAFAAIFQDMVRTGTAKKETMGELLALAAVHRFPARIKCAILPWHAMLAALEGETKPVSTQEMT